MTNQYNSLFTFMTFFFLLVLSGCTQFRGPSAEDNFEKNIQFLIDQGKLHWEKRVEPEEARLARLFLSRVHQIEPSNPEVTALYSRACQFLGYYIEVDPAQQDSLYTEGATIAWEILQETTFFREVFEKTEGDSIAKTIAALENLPMEFVPVLYWWVANYSRYLVDKPVIERLNNRDVIETALHRILALDPSFFYGGPHRIFGGILARIPGVELAHSYTYFNQALRNSPDYLGTYVLRAQYLQTKAGNREQFVKDLEFVINADPTLIPEVMPENLLEQEKARELLARESLLFE